MSDPKPSRGFQGAVVKLLRAGDYELTVIGSRQLSPHYLRLSFEAGWPARGSSAASDDVDPDVVRRRRQVASTRRHSRRPGSAGRHRRHRVRVARRSRLQLGAAPPSPATPPRLRSWQQLHAFRTTSGWLRHRRRHRVAAGHQITAHRDRRCTCAGVPGGRARRRQTTAGGTEHRFRGREEQNGSGVGRPRERRRGARGDGPRVGVRRLRAFGWVACDNRTTRAVSKIFCEDYKIAKKSIKAQAYWVA
jgi:NADPH-dependent ferric siderophore reductase